MVATLTEPQNAGGVPGKSSLFFLTVTRSLGRRLCRSRLTAFSFFLGSHESEEEGEGGYDEVCSYGSAVVLASLESGYLEKGNDDWQSVSFSEASGVASDSP